MRLTLMVSFFPLVVITSGCQPGAGNSGEIVIGHYGSMTGSEATFGQSTDNGIKLAVEEINEAGKVFFLALNQIDGRVQDLDQI